MLRGSVNGKGSNNTLGGLVGKIIAKNSGADVTITASYATGAVKGGLGLDTLGGLVGKLVIIQWEGQWERSKLLQVMLIIVLFLLVRLFPVRVSCKRLAG